MRIHKVLGATLLCGAILAGLAGCKEDKVNKDQLPSAFKMDVENKLKDFENRLSKVKSEMSGRAEGVRNTVKVATELAEEKIETLRDSTLSTLMEAVNPEEIDRIKDTINRTLDEIDDSVARAEDRIADARSKREVYAESTSKALDELRELYDDVKSRAKDIEGAVKAEVDQALESAEEAIQEADRSLSAYEAAAEDQVDEIEGNIDSLILEAKEKLDKAASSLGG